MVVFGPCFQGLIPAIDDTKIVIFFFCVLISWCGEFVFTVLEKKMMCRSEEQGLVFVFTGRWYCLEEQQHEWQYLVLAFRALYQQQMVLLFCLLCSYFLVGGVCLHWDPEEYGVVRRSSSMNGSIRSLLLGPYTSSGCCC